MLRIILNRNRILLGRVAEVSDLVSIDRLDRDSVIYILRVDAWDTVNLIVILGAILANRFHLDILLLIGWA